MIVNILIDCGNAAFHPNAGPEVARILAKLAKEAEKGVFVDIERKIFDCNGNATGVIRVEDMRLTGLKPDIHARNGRSSIS